MSFTDVFIYSFKLVMNQKKENLMTCIHTSSCESRLKSAGLNHRYNNMSVSREPRPAQYFSVQTFTLDTCLRQSILDISDSIALALANVNK
jgi:hypothetical protein